MKVFRKIEFKSKDFMLFSNLIARLVRKKKPEGKSYPYLLHDPYETLGEKSGYENTYLVGDNWISDDEKPIVIIFGCNDWKFGFIADYLHEYRVAFFPRKYIGFNAIRLVRKLNIRPSKAFIWGYTEKNSLKVYLTKFRRLSISRIEDGFLRSADLGAAHTTPYSLVFDDSGMYYDSTRPSDIERILSNYKQEERDVDYRHVEQALDNLVENQMSKYNPPNFYRSEYIKTKKIVLVIGQVDSDASLKYGNPDNWKMESVVLLAKRENPKAKILYRPHPEVYRGYQKSKFRASKVTYIAEVVSPEESIIELLQRVDKVYTISSLTGFEALLYGKQVTVMGKPFYAGWGLTDDRCSVIRERRGKELTLLEMFHAVYFLYPRYLIKIKNKDLKAGEVLAYTIGKIKADRLELSYLYNFKDKVSFATNDLYQVTRAVKHSNESNINEIVKVFTFFSSYKIHDVLLAFFWGRLENIEKKIELLRIISNLVDTSVLVEFVKNSKNNYSSLEYNLLLVQILSANKNIRHEELASLLDDTKQSFNHERTESQNRVPTDDNSVQEFIEETAYSQSPLDMLENELQVKIREYDCEGSIGLIKNIISIGELSPSKLVSILNGMSNIFYSKFDFKRSQGVALLSILFEHNLNNRKGLVSYIDASYIVDNYSTNDIIDFITMSLNTNPVLISKYRMILGRDSAEFAYLSTLLNLDGSRGLSKVNGLIENGMYEEAKKLFLQTLSFEKYNNEAKAPLLYADILHAEGESIRAIEFLEGRIEKQKDVAMLRKLIALYLFVGEFNKASELIDECRRMGADLNSTIDMPILQHKKEIGAAYSLYLSENFTKDLSYLLKGKFRKVGFNNSIEITDKSLIMAVYGPGDEIRFSTIYPDLYKLFHDVGAKFSLTCDFRLYELFARSFPYIDFLPVRRTRGISAEYPAEDYDLLPDVEMSTILDNVTYKKLDSYNNTYLVTDFISKVRGEVSDFPIATTLRAKDELIKKYSERLESYKHGSELLIGISWRSSLTNFSRVQYYLTAEELAPVWAIENVRFVNLQYDECEEELNWINEVFGDKIINFEDLDQYNDFESVSALIVNLDFVISPATTVAELAGALGAETWLISNSAELDWRKKDTAKRDVWHNSVQILDHPDKGDKTKLVNEIKNKILSRLQKKR